MANILTIIPFNFYPPVTGGGLRCFHIVNELSKNNEVYVLTVQPLEDFYNVSVPVFPSNVKLRTIPSFNLKSFSFLGPLPKRFLTALYYRFLRGSLRGTTNQFLLDVYPVLTEVLKDVNFDAILFENLESVELTSTLCRKISGESLLIYDAHNIDSELWLQLSQSKKSKRYKEYAYNALLTEKFLYKKVDAYFCCSSTDNQKLFSLNSGKIYGNVIPNGVDVETRPFDTSADKSSIQEIIFCGTLDTVPNKEGLLWFYENVFPIVKRLRSTVTLTVIGRVTQLQDYEKLVNDPSVNFIGNVEAVTPYYKESSVAIVPLLSGSGTRLKILEAMSLGNPVVSTSIGAEGINCKSGENIFITDDPGEFANYIDTLIDNEVLFNKMRFKALNLVKSTYDWKVIGTQISEALCKMIDDGSCRSIKN